MWFAKWFGGRDEEHEADEPARFPPAPVRTDPLTRGPRPPQLDEGTKPSLQAVKAKKGFDPYNSGAFERKNAWERTNLR